MPPGTPGPGATRAQQDWAQRFDAYAAAHPELAADFKRRMAGDLPADFAEVATRTVGDAHEKAATVASRKASQLALEHFTAALPELLGGSADLTGSNLTNTPSTPALRFGADGAPVLTDGKPGRHINYGVREFGMAAIMNGIALHGGHIPYGGTFLTFSDYSRNAIRMAALMKLRVIHVFTHDSIGLGEDGPTHQSVEHAASLRLIPNLDVWRPADTTETAVAWTMALANRHRPTALLLSRQNLPYCPRTEADVITQGAYVVAEPGEVGLTKKAQAVIIATGSEVQLAPACPGAAGPGQDRRARGLDAKHHGLRPTERIRQAPGAARRLAAHRRRGRSERWLVEVRRGRRRGRGHLRRIRPRERGLQAFRAHAGQCGEHRQGRARTLSAPRRPRDFY